MGPRPWGAELRRWCRGRPFWAGLLLILGGTELLLVPLSPLTVLVSLGLGGLAAIGIGLALIVAGLFLWYAPASHRYVSVNALILSVLSFAATNLGGFLVGMALGIAGGAMGFGWTAAGRGEGLRGGEDGAEGAEGAEGPEGAEDARGAEGARGVEGGEPGSPGVRSDGRRARSDSHGASSDGGRAPSDSHGAPSGGRRTRRFVRRASAVVLPLALLAAVGVPARQAQAVGAVPPAAARPPTVTTTLFAPQGFTVAGVTRLPTADGPLTVMVLKMPAASLTDYRLTTRDGGDELSLGADSLSLHGDVTLYLTKFRGCLQGALCLTFTPDRLPVPPVVPPFVEMTDVVAEQALVTSDLIVADGLRLRAG